MLSGAYRRKSGTDGTRLPTQSLPAIMSFSEVLRPMRLENTS